MPHPPQTPREAGWEAAWLDRGWTGKAGSLVLQFSRIRKCVLFSGVGDGQNSSAGRRLALPSPKRLRQPGQGFSYLRGISVGSTVPVLANGNSEPHTENHGSRL